MPVKAVLALILCLSFLQGRGAFASTSCAAIFKAPASRDIVFKNAEGLDQAGIEKMFAWIHDLLPDLAAPPRTLVEVVPRDPKNNSFFQGEATVLDEIFVISNPRTYPLMVHEYGHLIIEASLARDLSAYREERVRATKILKLVREKSELLKSFITLTAVEQRDRARRISEVESERKILLAEKQEKSRNLLAIAPFFEEIFSDLLASIYYSGRPDLFESTSRPGWRDLSVPKKNYPRNAEADAHYALQELGAYIYAKYTIGPEAAPQVALAQLYGLIRDQLAHGLDSGWLANGKLTIIAEENQPISINGRKLVDWRDELRREFDRRMKRALK